MWKDPIVQETRSLREAFASQYGHDADAIFQAILERQAQSPRPKVSYAPGSPLAAGHAAQAAANRNAQTVPAS